jgi:glycosyltransferase involved in cell wall biosynthesis
MNYAVPALLARAGMLDAFYTDLHAGDWPARLISRCWPAGRLPKPLRRLLGRRVPPEVPPEQIYSVPFRALLGYYTARFRDPGADRRLLKRGVGSANALYALAHGHLEVIQAAKQSGLFVAFEQVLNPNHLDTMRQERDRFPGIEVQPALAEEELYVRIHRSIWDSADVILSPSEYVTRGIVALGGPPERIRLVPYGVPERLLDVAVAPQPGRVLFVGEVGLRKGAIYLAEAARILKSRGISCEVRIVGPSGLGRSARFEFAGPTYVGVMPRSEIWREFASADIFVLPTLAEGCATAHLEALAYGLPVITTPNCGPVSRDGVEGFIVPVRDPVALADRIALLLGDRLLREQMSRHARERARQFTWERYQERLLAALSGPDR